MGTAGLILLIIGTIIVSYFLVKLFERLIKKRFFKIKSVLTAATAYDLCQLYRQKIISERELLDELSRWIFVPEDKDRTQLKTDWQKILPPDPFGSFEEQIGRAYADGLISQEIYNYLMKTYVTTDDIKKQQENDE